MDSDTPKLLAACANGDIDFVRQCLDGFFSPSQADEDGITPLMAACYGDRTEVVELLLERGACPKKRDKFGGTPLHYAVNGMIDVRRSRDMPRTVVPLLKAGCDPKIGATENGTTPLMAAACFGMDDLVALLVMSGVPVDIPDADGVTPLMAAIEGGHASTTAVLIGLGADVGREDDSGRSALRRMSVRTLPGLAAEIAKYDFPNAPIAERKGLDAMLAVIRQKDGI